MASEKSYGFSSEEKEVEVKKERPQVKAQKIEVPEVKEEVKREEKAPAVNPAPTPAPAPKAEKQKETQLFGAAKLRAKLASRRLG